MHAKNPQDNNSHLVELEHFKAQVEDRRTRLKGSVRTLAIAFAVSWWPGLLISAMIKGGRSFWYNEAFEITFLGHLVGTALFAGVALMVWLTNLIVQAIALAGDRSDQEKLMWESMMAMQRELNETRSSQYPPPPDAPVGHSLAAPSEYADPATQPRARPAPSQSPTLPPPAPRPAAGSPVATNAVGAPPVMTGPPPTPSDRTILALLDHNLPIRFTPPFMPSSSYILWPDGAF
jgi:hypothetical protein